jgi:hypothetical protein
MSASGDDAKTAVASNNSKNTSMSVIGAQLTENGRQ